LKKHIAVLVAIAVVVMGQDRAAAQITPGAHYFEPFVGAILAETRAVARRRHLPDAAPVGPTNPVITDIKLDPGPVFRPALRLWADAQAPGRSGVLGGISIVAIRQLEIKPDVEEGDQPQYETTTHGRAHHAVRPQSHVLRRHVAEGDTVSSHSAPWSTSSTCVRRARSMPIRCTIAPSSSAGTVLPATDRLGIRLEIRDYMYNFRFDNQFIDPGRPG
jgi:hypothetical protein